MDTLAIITRLAERRMTQVEAARCLGRSERQVRRLLRAFERDGPAGLRDKRRGRPAPNRIPEAYQAYVLGLVRERYRDFGPTLAGEKLEEKLKKLQPTLAQTQQAPVDCRLVS